MVERSGAGGGRGGSKDRARKAGRRGAKAGAKRRASDGSERTDRKGRGGRKGRDGRERRDGREGRAAGDGRARRDGRAGGRPGRGPTGGPREGRVVALLDTSSTGQRLIVEDDARLRWQVECLGEAVGEGAQVRFEPLAGGDTPQGVLVRVLDDARSAWVCTLRQRGSSVELVPFGGVETPPLVLAPRQTKAARPGDRVLVTLEREEKKRGAKAKRPRPATRGRALAARIVEVFGPAGDPDADHRALVWKYRLPPDFSRRARLEVEALPDSLPAAVLAGRVDLRDRPFITIDPATARDHDDALFAEPRPRRALELVESHASWTDRLWVAIADVSHYVAPGSFVDAEARRRGNSFYFPDRAIPMLPERLSSELCSLVPDEDRLVLAVELRLSATGEILDALFHEAVIRSHAKLSYEDAAERLARSASDAKAPPIEPPWLASLVRLGELAKRLAAHRRAAGAIELELPEVEISVDETGRPVDAALRLRNPAHGLVEEAMLAANCAVAKALERARRDTLHRVHPSPDPRRLEALALLLERFGVDAGESLDEPGAIAGFLERVRGWPAQERIHLATLRAMSQARYEARSRGHFALQFPHYLHFTSPIRRYADLVVHRSLKALVRGVPESDADAPVATGSGAPAELERLALWLSGRERVAIDAEREAAAFACCALLAGREGEGFDAEVTGVAEPGLFVRLERPSASGLVPLRLLDPRWRLDVEEECVEDGAAGRRIEVGTKLRVRLVHVDGDRGRIAFALAGSGERRPRDQASARDSESVSHSR